MKKLSFLLLLPLFILNCARQTSPTGGPKDTIPPTLDYSYPKNGAINVKESSITLTFDETVIVQNAKDQIIIIPSIGKDYEITAKKNKVTVDLKTALADSTTYSFTFRESIVDITEKNVPENLKLAFSTGNYIDSLIISGKATDLLLNKELKDVTIALYQSDTFNIFKHQPTYITKSNEKGEFNLTNLKPGNYYIYAFIDKNRNLITDPKSESYGFVNSKINLSNNVDTIKLALIRLDTRPLKLTSARPYNTYFNIKTTKQLTDYKLKAQGHELISNFGEDNSIIKLYKNFEEDSLAINLSGTDSALNTLDTTFYAKFSTRQTTPERFSFSTKNTFISQTKSTLETTLTFTKPISQINLDSLLIKLDSLHVLQFTSENFKIDTINKTLSIIKKLDRSLLTPPTPNPQGVPAKTIQPELYMGKGSFVSLENDSSESYSEKLKLLTPETTGVLLIKVQTTVPNFILQLKNKNFETIKTATNTKDIKWEDILPGDYQLILIPDTDKNGKWSPGNKLLNTEPEKVIYYTNEKKSTIINLKANWELGPLLITY